MKTDSPTVHCIFPDNAPTLPALIHSAFRLHLQHMLQQAMPHVAPTAPVNEDAL